MKILNDFPESIKADVDIGFFKDSQYLPIVVMSKNRNKKISDWSAENRTTIDSLLTKYGGILFRGFGVESADEFSSFVGSTSSGAIEYNLRSSPRTAVGKNVYTSTDHPKHEEIYLHCEQSYNQQFVRKIYFYCAQKPTNGGNTPIADTRKIYNRIHHSIRSNFLDKQYRYARCFWQLVGMPWQTSFQTTDKKTVEQYCSENDIHYKWQADEILKTYQIRHAIATHPVSGEKCWFNHCAFFHISNLDKATRDVFVSSFSEDEYPNNTYYGDGSRIEADVMSALDDAYQQEKVEFQWEEGDVLMLDNMLTAHGRRPFDGDRVVLTAMSDMCSWSDIQIPTDVDENPVMAE